MNNNPCIYCDKADIRCVNDFEYGCDEPCKKTKDCYKSAANEIEELYEEMIKSIKPMEEKEGK